MMSSKRTITMGTELRLEALFMFLLGPFESIRQMRMLLWSRVPQFDRSRSRASHCALSRAAPILAKLCSTDTSVHLREVKTVCARSVCFKVSFEMIVS
jgi:hypothetical protein